MVYDLKYGFLTPFVGIGECTRPILNVIPLCSPTTDGSLRVSDSQSRNVLYVSLVARCVVYCGHKLLQSEHTVLQRLLRLEAFALDLLLILVPCAYSFSHASIHVLRHT